MRKLALLCLILTIGTASLLAGGFITANDLEPASLTAAADFDGVQILATAEKNVTIEDLGDSVREAVDGEVFNSRIKLNGSGKPEYRAIRFTSDTDGATLVVYLNSSSKTDARTLIVARPDGSQVTTLTAPPDSSDEAGIASCVLPEAGEYLVYSKSSGINIYMLYC